SLQIAKMSCEYLKRVLNIQERLLGSQHPVLRDPLSWLAKLYESQQRRKEALLVYERLLVIQERVLGPEHPHTQATQRHLTSLGATEPSHLSPKTQYEDA